MIINKDQTLAEVKQEFENKFLGLKLEFYGHKHKPEEGSKISDQLDPAVYIKDITSVREPKDLTLDFNMTVEELEDLFENELKLHVQVFRKSNNVWLQTTKTDHWTLEKQCRKAMRSIEEGNKLMN